MIIIVLEVALDVNLVNKSAFLWRKFIIEVAKNRGINPIIPFTPFIMYFKKKPVGFGRLDWRPNYY